MATKLSNKIVEALINYTQGSFSLRELRDWMGPIAWDIEDSGDQDAISLVYSAELAFSEFDHGHLTAHELHKSLQGAIPKYSELYLVKTGSSSFSAIPWIATTTSIQLACA